MNGDKVERKVDYIHQKEQFWHKYLLQIIILIFMAGGGWVTLSNVQAMAEENAEAIEEERRDKTEIKEKLIRIEVTQDNIKEEIKEAKKQTQENADKLDKILEELRDR